MAQPMSGAFARSLLRIASGLPHPSEAHDIYCKAMGDRAPAELAQVRAQVAQLARDHRATPERVWGALIEAAGKRCIAKLIQVLAALHEAQQAGEVAT